MRILFAGTPEFAAQDLSAVLRSRHQVMAVLTQPDRPAGRGYKPVSSPVKQVAQAAGLALFQPERLKGAEVAEWVKTQGADVLVVSAYGLLVPADILALFPLGAINVHASLLPRWRGAAPIQRAIQAGDSHTGISIMQMEAGLDTGPVLLSEACEIRPQDNSKTLHDRLAPLGARLLIQALDGMEHGIVKTYPQSPIGMIYAHKITKEEALLDWSKPAEQLERTIRALNPAPVCRTMLRGAMIKIWEARTVSGRLPGGMDPARPPYGRIVALTHQSCRVVCGEGLLDLTVLQKAGGKPQPVDSFCTGFQISVGDV